MGKRVPLIREDTGATIGSAMILNYDEPLEPFTLMARADGVLVGVSITDPDIRRKIVGDIGAFSIAVKSTAEVTAEFNKRVAEADGEELARGMQDEIDGDFNVEGDVRG